MNLLIFFYTNENLNFLLICVEPEKYLITSGPDHLTWGRQSWARGYKTVFHAEHEILNAHKYENIKKLSIFQAQISLKCYSFLLINVKMPTNANNCWHFNIYEIYERKENLCLAELSLIFFIISGPALCASRAFVCSFCACNVLSFFSSRVG